LLPRSAMPNEEDPKPRPDEHEDPDRCAECVPLKNGDIVHFYKDTNGRAHFHIYPADHRPGSNADLFPKW
jgi:hypothetical protein